MHDVFCPIKWDLVRVREKMNRHYKLRAGHLNSFSHLDKHLETDICPALVLYAARIYGSVTEKVISLAQVFQFIYLAVMLHQDINEDEQIKERNYTEPRDGCQYPVLVGDYLYGRFFTTLCDADIVEYLGPLSGIICMINEGGILRLKSQREKEMPGTRREIIRLEMAELMAGCCKLGGQIAGADREGQSYLYKFGFSLGMGVGMARFEVYEQADVYFNEAQSFIEYFPPGKDRDDLKDLVVFLNGRIKERQKMVC
ncbi:MAG: polyprenyl synthetase family protein [Bacillota bacterium]